MQRFFALLIWQTGERSYEGFRRAVPVDVASRTLTDIAIGVVTVSDRASQGVYEDKGGPGVEAALRDLIASTGARSVGWCPTKGKRSRRRSANSPTSNAVLSF